ncbi:MAG: hydrogenase maturation nickel metallochaperone HypA [Chloroflexota bacterium]|nr:hydrogenase maturation nickel metallochaperone HypA [Anaerolineales bacterium]MCK5794825.1 hydrogenase maturation nickel metallochaperone HypA [Anaerolineales bacterium]RLD06898.1 MAG: hydrogenase maturation nickel metallochaperone HypA [Chloroflexota bacterium]HDD62332.1 hydrogenase maturation nickel metallochaperone HypA [Chloroflexota bacterium]
MHELAITEQIADIAIRHGEKNKAAKITDLYLVIGELSTVIDESVQFYWDLITEDTICAGAKLHFHRIPAKFHCLDCGKEYQMVDGELSPCPFCQSTSMKILEGKEFHLDSINII